MLHLVHSLPSQVVFVGFLVQCEPRTSHLTAQGSPFQPRPTLLQGTHTVFMLPRLTRIHAPGAEILDGGHLSYWGRGGSRWAWEVNQVPGRGEGTGQ